MDYYSKLSKNNLIGVVWILISVYNCFKFYFKHDTGWLYSWIPLAVFFCLLTLPRVFFVLYSLNFRKPIFSVNESIIYDRYKNIKYYWNDIDEVVASDAFLEIILYKPDEYLKNIRNPFFRSLALTRRKIFRRELPFKIDMDLISIKKGENGKFVETINNYSIQNAELPEN